MYKAKIDSSYNNAVSDIYAFRLSWNGPKIEPGQFIRLKPITGMWRPFSAIVFGNNNFVHLLFNVVGPNTKHYSTLKERDEIDVDGPFGNPIPVDKNCPQYILISGGTGAAPLISYAYKLEKLNKSFSVIVGAKNCYNLCWIRDAFPDYWFDCRFGFKNCTGIKRVVEKAGDSVKSGIHCAGYPTNYLSEQLKSDFGKSTVVACGPRPMLKKVAEMCKASGNKCYVLLEEMVACGVGACKACAVFGKNGKVMHLCTEGPCFDAEWIDWERLVPDRPAVKLAHGDITDDSLHISLQSEYGRILELNSPILPAAGCLSLESIELTGMNVSIFGAGVTKGVTREKRAGNQTPRICEPGPINSIGLENSGIDDFIKYELPVWQKKFEIVIVNISGPTIGDFVYLAGRLAEAGVKAIELNISCPNLGGRIFGTSPALTGQVVYEVRKAVLNMFIIVKLSPSAGSKTVKVGAAAVNTGADCLNFGNTYESMAIDVYTLRPKLGANFGGQSGPSIHNPSIKKVFELYRADLGVPIIGTGGVHDWETAAEFIIAGASAVGVGTELLNNPNIAAEIRDGLLEWIKFHRVGWIGNLIGKVQLY